ncbi:MAG: hypothetical protein CL678_12585 [Bdellovibrionaceae bacterium]|nr:hypothetical protein [Pseudobdellovibrionaceae bacterium]|tara:strand:+ start:472 stop:1788 length:1317 start_codon:yes stop_codon:yes gene_type:complete
MKIQSLRLKQFRNISELELSPGPHLNFILGKNAQGKTSLIEGLSLLATLRSFRSSHASELISWGNESSEVECKLQSVDQSGSWDTHLKYTMSHEPRLKNPKKKAFINGKGYSSASSYLKQRFVHAALGFHTIVFHPADHELIRGEPKLRRNYLNQMICAENFDYLDLYNRYQRVLKQRNAVLKQEPLAVDILEEFTKQLIHIGAQLVHSRFEFLDRLSKQLKMNLKKIAPKQPMLDVFYLSSWLSDIQNDDKNQKANNLFINNNLEGVSFTGQGHFPSLEKVKKAFQIRLEKRALAEKRMQTTLVGPHRDDWTLLLGNQVLKGHGSQGEVRSALLALKLSEIDLFREKTGLRPVLLLDDISSELDKDRRIFLLKTLSETDLQVFVTSTEEVDVPANRFWIENGKLKESNDSSYGLTFSKELTNEYRDQSEFKLFSRSD